MLNFMDALKVIHNTAIVQNYAVMVVMIYLIDVWGLGITHAAALINIWAGMTKIMGLVFRVLMDSCIGSYSMLLISTTASALGMGLLSISTPSRLYSLITGSCSEYKMQCISETQQTLFYLALVLIMIGKSACGAAMETLSFKGSADEKEFRKKFVTSGTGYATLQGILLLLTPWSVIFAVPSLYSSIAVSLLMEKSWSHKVYINNAERSPFTSIVRVFVASFSKRPRKINGVYLPLSSLDREFEDARALVRILPVGVMYAFFLLISTICSTYFLQQAKRMKPAYFFRVEYIDVSYFAWLFFNEMVRNKFKYNDNYSNMARLNTLVIDAMSNAIICCATAALVEKSRLGVIREYGLANKPWEIIPMSRFWLLPQYGILGYFHTSLDPIRLIFFSEHMTLPMKNFKVFVFEAFFGIGMMSSVLVVYTVGKISEIGGRPNWFQHDTENSRLDLFYWALTALCVLVFTIWVQVFNYIKSRYPNYQQLGERKYRRR